MNPDYTVVNILSRGVLDPKWKQPIEALLEEISNGSDRLAHNYSLKNMDLPGHLSFDVLIDKHNNIISFSGVYNGGRYPEGVYRILNRTWVAKEARVSHGSFKYLTSKYILPAQLKNFSADLKLIFVSRANTAGRLFLKKWQSRQNPEENWQVSENLVQVVPGVHKKSCFQYICSRSFAAVDWNPDTLTESEWNSLSD